MALLTVEGIYKDGRIELSERPESVEATVRVLVTFLPASDVREGSKFQGRCRPLA